MNILRISKFIGSGNITRIYILRIKKLLILCLIPIVITAISILIFEQCKKKTYIDKEYLQALSIADRYLYAWVMRDVSIAYDLISDNMKKGFINLKDFQIYFAGVSNPHHQAFEIYGYKRLTENRMRLQIWLYEDYTGMFVKPYNRPVPSFLELIKVDKGKWLVDKIF